MADIFQAILFTVLIAAGGLGVSSIVMTLLPSANPTADAKEQAKSKVEYAFFGFAGIIIAFVMWVAMWLS
ncbi:MAG: hypothetical protein HLUCCO02_01825 [Idiomarinaceae bacterium HL-53]|nr:MAG: hypothetical protein HLUCCO02_01825 [Idiomarinaceae bacterium HL-53]CUS48762.1 hypothetical protein Ga0003345_1737 [Idiomarinaceae bacterium HL-53]